MLENRFKTNLVRELKERFPGCIVLHIDPTEIQGMPDLLVLYRDRWAALEGKRTAKADPLNLYRKVKKTLPDSENGDSAA